VLPEISSNKYAQNLPKYGQISLNFSQNFVPAFCRSAAAHLVCASSRVFPRGWKASSFAFAVELRWNVRKGASRVVAGLGAGPRAACAEVGAVCHPKVRAPEGSHINVQSGLARVTLGQGIA
jgi:hypothetical protein